MNIDRFNSNEDTAFIVTDEVIKGEFERKIGNPLSANPYSKTTNTRKYNDWKRGWCDMDMVMAQSIEDVMKYTFEPEKLPFWKRLQVYCEFDSQIKSIWLTGYILITWEWDYNFWETLDISWYSGGSYG